ncbi:hypothetical protein VV86_22195 [Vibrio vulnificus]|nr:hypothetical protein VV86_22195 [Vibrio vulnificus]
MLVFIEPFQAGIPTGFFSSLDLYPSYLKLQRCWLHSFTGTPARPNHIAYLCSWGFTHLPPTCNFKLFGYILCESTRINL